MSKEKKHSKEIEKECKCKDNDCHCMEGEKCTCGDDCQCKDGECHCDEDCHCAGKKDKHKKKREEYKKTIEELNQKLKESEQKILAEKAELINYRKRKDDEVRSMLKYANEDMVKELLSTVDNFERAIKLDDDNLDDELSKFLEGFKMIYCNLVNILENYGVKAIDGGNKPFDSTYHQAVLTEKREGVESGMVLEVLQKGYLLKDKVIRPAMVKVSE